MKSDYGVLIDKLREGREIIVCGHINPDPDCIGAMLALDRAFSGESQGWRLVMDDAVPSYLDYLQGIERFITPADLDIKPHTVLLIDCSEPERCGKWLPPLIEQYRPELFCLDHHLSNDFTGDGMVLETDAAASGEIAAVLIAKAGIEIDTAIAAQLYTAIVGDTGCFRYTNTTPRTMRIGADLLDKHIDAEQIRIRLFESHSLKNMQMIRVAFDNMQIEADGQLCYMVIDYQSKLNASAGDSDCDNIVSNTLTLSGVKIGLLFEEHPGLVKVSMRCRNGYRVDQLAQHFGGGGHLLASGCRVKGSLEQVKDQVLTAALQLL